MKPVVDIKQPIGIFLPGSRLLFLSQRLQDSQIVVRRADRRQPGCKALQQDAYFTQLPQIGQVYIRYIDALRGQVD